MEAVVLAILNALTLISILALVSIGLAIIFGMMDIINFAHGEFMTIGAYTLAYIQSLSFFLAAGGRPWTRAFWLALIPGYAARASGLEAAPWVGAFWLALMLAPVAGALVGILIEAAVIRRLYTRPLETILATLGISLILQKGIELTFGSRPQIIYDPIRGTLPVLGVDYPAYRVFIIAFSFVIITVCLVVFRNTQFGLDLRALIQNRDMAEALGINTRRVSRLAFMAGAALAALAGVLIAPLASVEANLGIFYLGRAFFVVIVGGTGTIAGVLAGSGLIGGLETALSYPMHPSLAFALVMITAIVLVRLRPRGLIPGFSFAHELLGKK